MTRTFLLVMAGKNNQTREKEEEEGDRAELVII